MNLTDDRLSAGLYKLYHGNMHMICTPCYSNPIVPLLFLWKLVLSSFSISTDFDLSVALLALICVHHGKSVRSHHMIICHTHLCRGTKQDNGRSAQSCGCILCFLFVLVLVLIFRHDYLWVVGVHMLETGSFSVEVTWHMQSVKVHGSEVRIVRIYQKYT